MRLSIWLYVTIAALNTTQTLAAGPVCSSGIYAVLAGLDSYPPAREQGQKEPGPQRDILVDDDDDDDKNFDHTQDEQQQQQQQQRPKGCSLVHSCEPG
ncbi:hypothetical protein LTR10_014751 [Elasticomyces elasticus]|nr:hypothetical protein LTR10_014751 [Elasticomyces elasticus]